ncbi:MAG: Na+/H+ antiporter NhaA [Actinobacteria bacterium]|nr:Na+/H+ antiporter NhaA [Actinomycetota bacterium]
MGDAHHQPGPAAADAVRPTFLHSERALARYLARPVARFLAVEAAGGVLLLVATVVALVWANSPWRASYTSVFTTEIAVRIGGFGLGGDLTRWIDDGLMSVFFLVVGLEIKREVVAGELRDRRTAALPAVAAAGGMVVPALVYAAVNAGTVAGRGWGIPIATDIAFAAGVLAVLGRRVPRELKVFLLALAIVDDIGAIVVIALFYGGELQVAWLAGAAAVVGLVVVLRRLHVAPVVPYVGLGLALWLALREGGVHPTLAGVAMGLLAPATPFQPPEVTDAIVDRLEGRPELNAREVHGVWSVIRGSVPLTERLEDLLHPWTSYVVVPVFALANAGVPLTGAAVSGAPRVAAGVALGLVAGKAVGIAGTSWLAVRLGVGRLPPAVRWAHLVGAALLGGIGFTVSLFVAGLAFDGAAAPTAAAKVGILGGSLAAAVAGSTVLLVAARRR